MKCMLLQVLLLSRVFLAWRLSSIQVWRHGAAGRLAGWASHRCPCYPIILANTSQPQPAVHTHPPARPPPLTCPRLLVPPPGTGPPPPARIGIMKHAFDESRLGLSPTDMTYVRTTQLSGSSAGSSGGASTSSANDSSSNGGLSGGAVAGIVVGSALSGAALVGVAWMLVRRRRRARRAADGSPKVLEEGGVSSISCGAAEEAQQELQNDSGAAAGQLAGASDGNGIMAMEKATLSSGSLPLSVVAAMEPPPGITLPPAGALLSDHSARASPAGVGPFDCSSGGARASPFGSGNGSRRGHARIPFKAAASPSDAGAPLAAAGLPPRCVGPATPMSPFASAAAIPFPTPSPKCQGSIGLKRSASLPTASAADRASGRSGTEPATSSPATSEPTLPELEQHVAACDAMLSSDRSACRAECSLAASDTLPPSLQACVADMSQITFLRRPNGSPQEIGCGAR